MDGVRYPKVRSRFGSSDPYANLELQWVRLHIKQRNRKKWKNGYGNGDASESAGQPDGAGSTR